MFDSVAFEAPCPHCGEKLSGFQTKDGACQLETLMPWQVYNFYTSCDACGAWVEYERPRPIAPVLPPPEPPGWLREFVVSWKVR